MKRLLNLFKKKEEIDITIPFNVDTKPTAVNKYDTDLQRVMLQMDIAKTQRELALDIAEKERFIAMIGSSAYCPPPGTHNLQSEDTPQFADVDDINEGTVITIHNKGEQQNVRLGDLITAMKKINTMNNANK